MTDHLGRTERSDYCRSCDGYTAEVGKLDADGWCERCSYRNQLQAIVDADPVDLALDPTWTQRNAAATLKAWES